MAVYAMGEGWTGALGTGSLDQIIPGHEDEESSEAPVLVYPGPVKSVAAGWGHSAVVTLEGKLLVCGRPHDFSTLLRLKRMPVMLRQFALARSLKTNETEDTLSGRFISWMVGSDDGPDGPWKDARRNSILQEYCVVEMPEKASSVVASAGLTAVLTETGRLYTFGLNHYGQCGIGKSSNNVWTPEPVLFAKEVFITSVALGLQHGMALDSEGTLYVWGKGERGQLGLREKTSCDEATRVTKFRLLSKNDRQNWASNLRIKAIAAGMSHSAAVTEDNMAFVWGKNMARAQEDLVDVSAPTFVNGLPQHVAIQDIACGSHHTAMLLEDGSVWAVGFATDNSQPILDAVEVVPPGLIDMPCSCFSAHFDRTTIVGKDGSQVLQVHLWSDEELRDQAVFTPAWMDYFEDKSIQSVERGWLHTLVATKD